MPNHNSLASLFEDIADAIRDKTGGSAPIVADDFPTAIAAISSCNVGKKTAFNDHGTATSLPFSGLSGRPKAFFVRCTTSLLQGSGSYYYVAAVRWDGSDTGGVAGNCFNRSSGSLSNVTSGYSYTWNSGTSTLTVYSSGSRSSSPGSFYTANYELVYVY